MNSKVFGGLRRPLLSTLLRPSIVSDERTWIVHWQRYVDGLHLDLRGAVRVRECSVDNSASDDIRHTR